jgi:serine protease Do
MKVMMDERNSNNNNFDENYINQESTNNSSNDDYKEEVYTNDTVNNNYLGGNNYSNNNTPSKPVIPKFSYIKVLVIVIITSLFTSSIVGGSLYIKFKSDLNKITDSEKTFSLDSSETDNSNNKSSSIKYTGSNNISKVVNSVSSSIVGIKITVDSKTSNDPFGIFGLDDTPQSAEGSGVIIDKSGYIVTNYHVVESTDPKSNSSNQAALEIHLQNKKVLSGKFIAGDSLSDLAVIKVDADNLNVAKLGDSSKISVGDPVIAIGNPLGIEFAGTVTTGIVSALDRSIESGNISQNLIQTDAAINAGNSGGALLNYNGEVIGINSMKISQTGVEGIGFAIPSNEVKPIVEQLIENKKVSRPMIGIAGATITEDIAKSNDIPQGVYVQEVSNESAADKSGIKKGDIIIELAGKKVESMSDINSIKNKFKIGDTAKIKVYRDKKEKTLSITFQDIQE